MTDHYLSLQIRRTATQGEVRAAYLQLAKQLHPDMNPGEEAARHFLAVKEAYEVLSDPERRQNYDAALAYTEQIERQRAEAEAARARVDFFKQQEQAAPRTAGPGPGPRPGTGTAARPAAAEAASEEREAASRLRDLMKTGRYRDAEAMAKGMIHKNPQSAEAWAAMGDIHRSRGRMDEAAKCYAYAYQFNPTNLSYERMHLEMLEAAASARPEPTTAEGVGVAGPPAWPFMALAGVLVVLVCWMVVDRSPLIPAAAPISQWTVAAFGGLLMGGLAAGVCLSAGDVLDRFSASQGAASTRVPPAVTLGVVALLNFWVAAAVYAVVGMVQSAFNRSLSWAFGAAAAVVGASALAVLSWSGEGALQVLLWGGSLAYAGVLCGWLAADSLRR